MAYMNICLKGVWWCRFAHTGGRALGGRSALVARDNHWLLFLRTVFKLNLLSELELFGRFWTEDRVRTFPSIEPIGLADWWKPANAFGDACPIGNSPTLAGGDGS